VFDLTASSGSVLLTVLSQPLYALVHIVQVNCITFLSTLGIWLSDVTAHQHP